MKIGTSDIGAIDAKEEFDGVTISEDDFFDRLLIPDSIDLEKFRIGGRYFFYGFRGVGKTSLLRYMVFSSQPKAYARKIILFKSEVSETQRTEISQQAGFEWTNPDPAKMEFSQDFKASWQWFVCHKIGELIQESALLVTDDVHSQAFLRLLGLTHKKYDKVLGYLPRLKGGRIRVAADAEFIKAELEGDFEYRSEKEGTVVFEALVAKLIRVLERVSFKERIVLGFDELEAFHISREQYDRDLRLVRDLAFSVDRINKAMRLSGRPIYLYCAIRSEVLGAMGALGQEVDRLVYDRGTNIVWHHAPRSLEHPLLNVVRKKIKASIAGFVGDPIVSLFPDELQGELLEVFLLDRSFYRPRDLMWRLSLAIEDFPNATKFSEDVLLRTEGEYSNRLWAEIEYEISAIYTPEEIEAITTVLSGAPRYFRLQDVVQRAKQREHSSEVLRVLNVRENWADILRNLYRLGAIGNNFRSGSRGQFRNRWVFRGDKTLLVDEQMEINPALAKHLSAIDPRRRGGRGRKRPATRG